MSTAGLFDFDRLYQAVDTDHWHNWCRDLRHRTKQTLTTDRHGLLPQWMQAWRDLPEIPVTSASFDRGAVAAHGDLTDDERTALREQLMVFHPWRKGPFELFGIKIDTEWRSDWKWDRVRQAVDLRDRMVLDVGCGNGYFGWRMLAAGAKLVAGLDPFLLYVMQHELLKKYFGADHPNFVLPVGDDCLPSRLHAFDVTFSMGVMYHRPGPIEHLQALHRSLKPGGRLILETLVVDSGELSVLVPDGRYAKMRNVWFLPSLSMLKLWLKRTGFRDAETVDVTRTTTQEQRRTEWMTFESLADFLDPADPSLTIEGYPAPLRAIVTART